MAEKDRSQSDIIQRELEGPQDHGKIPYEPQQKLGLYDRYDLDFMVGLTVPKRSSISSLQTLDDLLDRDMQREADGFPRRIKIGRIIRPSKDKKDKIVVVPTTTEPKFYHDNSITEEDDGTSGSGEGEEGDVIGEQEAEPQEGEGEGEGAGSGKSGDHDVSSDAFDLGKVLTEKFSLPNLQVKGKKRSFTKYIYDLTDRNREFGQILDKKETLRKIIQTNILLGRVAPNSGFSPDEFLINPKDRIYRIMSREKDFETQAVVFFIRDYSGSMQGKPTEVIATQHLFIYSWLMYQYKNNVETRFILHDTEAKEVPDFYTYHNSQIAGGTNVSPAYELVNKIVGDEQLARDNNIYVFHGTDGDDWEEKGDKAIAAIKTMLTYVNRFGITVARNLWAAASKTTVEKYIETSNLLKQYPKLIRIDSMQARSATEDRIIESIKKLTE